VRFGDRSVGLTWLLVLVVVVASLVGSELADRPPLTNAGRVHDLAGDFACPVCQGQSLGESDVPIARTIRTTIRTMVDRGRTDAEIRSMLVARFGEDIDYTPRGDGLVGLVWVLPVLVGGAAVAGVTVSIRRWQGRPIGGSAPGRPVVLGVVAVVVVLAGVLVARSVGDRSAGDTLSGDIRSSTRTLLADAGVASPDEAVSLYSRVLEIQPSNVEALAYRGWSHWRAGDRARGRSDLDEAVAVDPAYPDVRVFRASQRHADGNHAGAAEDLVVLDGLEAPPIVGDLLSASRLRQRIATGLASSGELLVALELLDSGLEARPGSADLLAERGWLLVATRSPELVVRGMANLDEALALDPLDPYGLAYRAVVLSTVVGRPGDAAADLAGFAGRPGQPADLVDLLILVGLLDPPPEDGS
jgi:cytochrome c-type biogenesis protein CcmH